jgi:glycosyltransferase involved in cell wall biosynthesis
MRALIFSTTYFPLVGGAEVALKELTNRMPDMEFDLICAKIKQELPDQEKIGNVTVHRVGSGGMLDKYLLPITGVQKAMQIGSADALPFVWSLMASYGGFAALFYCWMRPKTRFLLTLQEGDPLEHYAARAGSLNFLHKMIFRRANGVQAISRFLAEWAVKMGFRGTPEVIPNGVDIERFASPLTIERRTEIRQRHGFSENDTVLITASRLSYKNAVDDIIRALAKLPPTVKLLIAGDGEERNALQSLAKDWNVAQRVVFHGEATHDQLPELLKASDIFIRPSRSEGLGNAFLEAMAAELPIIGTNVGGIPDFLTDGETGLFCLPNHPESIAHAVTRLTHDASLRDQIAANGQRLVRQGYAWDDLVVRMRELITKTSLV